MINAARLLPKLLDAGDGNPRMTETAVKLAFARAAGAGMRRQAIPLRLNRRTLLVCVIDAIWRKQLQSFSGELILRINQLLGRNAIDFIEFRIDPATVNRECGELKPKQENRPPGPVSLEVVSAAATIADEELRQLFLRAAANCLDLHAQPETNKNANY